ncbi:ABC transporter substrate-binding protein [Lichenibacterium ramalinae]|uniref:ABC transporter ATP-binding protein n=1 Tax=Lichenibacterium ramalinae TaxID=2316527 RepID=A0A4Q2RIV6_9HYPH|nr:ABC transporter substrate-binding protein [Lichenibacterium ramalinae]RYB06985.1 ABC transporter ATP-binding protein [Lichenibacterium ramalinae]
MRLTALAGALLLGLATFLPAGAAETAAPPVASGPAPAAQKVTLLLDWFVNPVHAAIVIAKEKGFFARAGLDVSFVEPADPSMPPRLVAAGQGDIALTYQPNFYLDVAAGLPLQRIGTSIQTPLNTVMVLKDGPIKSLADLKGKTVGYSVAGYETALLGTMLESAGLKLDDVKLVNVNFALTQPLIGGQVDAVVGAYRNVEFFEMQLAGHPGKLFFPEEHGVPPYDESIFVTTVEKSHAPFVKPFLDAVGQAQLYILDYPDEAWASFVKAYPKLDDQLNKLAWGATVPRLSADPAATDPARYAAFATFMKDRGLIDRVEPLERYIGR